MNQMTVIETMLPEEIYGSGKLSDILGKITKEVRETPTDISTSKGRKEIASLAHKIARSKTYLDDLGKKIGEDAKKKLDAINAERKVARDELDSLKEEVRKPLTEWEEKEERRIAAHEEHLKDLTKHAAQASERFQNLSSKDIEVLIADLRALDRDWEEFELRARNDKTYGLARLEELLTQKSKQEAEAAELTRLRAEAAERERIEREDRIAKEAAERARIAAEALAKQEAERVAMTAKREADRLALAAEMERQQALKDKQAQEAKVHEAENAARRAEAEAARAVEAERARVEREKAHAAADEAKREANKKHKAKINNEIMAALNTHVEQPINESQVKSIIFAIATGKIPHTKISY